MKKTLALGMAAAMTATLLAGCGGSASSAASTAESTAASTEATSTAESTGSYTDYSAGFPENVTIQIPVYDRGFEAGTPLTTTIPSGSSPSSATSTMSPSSMWLLPAPTRCRTSTR